MSTSPKHIQPKLTNFFKPSVKRNELYSRPPSHEPSEFDPDLQTHFYDQLGKIYKNETGEPLILQADDAPTLANDQTGESPWEEEEAYEFRLFSAPTSKPSDPQRPHNAPQRIVLRSPTPPSGDPGFINPRRPDTYYFTGPNSPEKSEQYRTAAITAEEIFKGLAVRWRGAELPWRLIILKSPHSSSPLYPRKPATQPADNTTTTTLPSKHKRSGKKRRIAIRTKLAAKSAKELAKKQSLAEKEAAEKEKRTWRNREKKVKRKEKEKAKKAQGVDSLKG